MTNLDTSIAESFKYYLMNQQDQIVREIKVLPGGTLDMSTSAEIRTSASFDMLNADIDWLNARIRITYNNVPLITGIPKVSSQDIDSMVTKVSVDLYDKLILLTDDNFGGVYQVKKNVNTIDTVKSIVTGAGGTIAIPASSDTLDSNLVFEANTPKLTIVNTLLESAGYWALWADANGMFRSSPYITPQARPVAHNFVDDDEGTYLPAFTRSYDPFSVPNRYILIGKTSGKKKALTATATDTTTKYSYANRGRWVTITESDVAYTGGQSGLNKLAANKLAQARQVAETFEITHPYLGLNLNDAVTFKNRSISVKAVVEKMTYSLKPGGLIVSTLRSVTE